MPPSPVVVVGAGSVSLGSDDSLGVPVSTGDAVGPGDEDAHDKQQKTTLRIRMWGLVVNASPAIQDGNVSIALGNSETFGT